MSGSSGRRRGHGWEQLLARELSDVTGLDIRTGRFFGLTYGSDLVTVTGYDNLGRPVTYEPSVLGWAIEAKKVAQRNPNVWLTQARDQAAPGTTPVVLWSRKHHPWEKGSAFVYDDEAPRGWNEMTIAEWVAIHLMKEADDEPQGTTSPR